MRLDFNILWVEDQQKAVQAQCERIETLIRKEGFRLQTIFASSVNQAMSYLGDDIYGDHIDLILMDFDLGSGGRGDDGLIRVRQIFPYKDIVFYSAKAPDLPNMVAAAGVDGIFCSTRDDLPDTVDGLFENLVKKVLDIDHSRGIVMGATSDVDHYVFNCLTSIFNSCDESGRQAALLRIEKHAQNKCNAIIKSLKALSQISHIEEIQKNHNIYTSNDRLRLLKHMLEGDKSHVTSAEGIGTYIQNTVPKRNDLAHVRVEVNGFSRKLFSRNNVELTSGEMKQLRQELLYYQDFFEQLSESLSQPVQTER